MCKPTFIARVPALLPKVRRLVSSDKSCCPEQVIGPRLAFAAATWQLPVA